MTGLMLISVLAAGSAFAEADAPMGFSAARHANAPNIAFLQSARGKDLRVAVRSAEESLRQAEAAVPEIKDLDAKILELIKQTQDLQRKKVELVKNTPALAAKHDELSKARKAMSEEMQKANAAK
jgi:myosin-crossreactive antigen